MWIGLDIGGANLKASDGESRSVARPFSLWKHPERLAAELVDLCQAWPHCDAFAVTMTGELADCFATKSEGVRRILDAVDLLAADRRVLVWQTGSEFMSTDEAREFPRLVAAANWHALATWAGRMAPQGASLLIDIGSTTTDVIPISEGCPAPSGWTDVERLLAGELLYVGLKRTPLCAIARSAPFRGFDCPLAAELFATTLDLALLTGATVEDPDDCDTADGRPATRAAAHARLARMLCCDTEELDLEEARQVALALWDELEQTLSDAATRVVSRMGERPRAVLLSGSGEALARRIVGRNPDLQGADIISLREALGLQHSAAACAFALARLGRERAG